MAICRAKIFSYDLLLNPSPGLRYIVRKEKKKINSEVASVGEISLPLSLSNTVNGDVVIKDWFPDGEIIR